MNTTDNKSGKGTLTLWTDYWKHFLSQCIRYIYPFGHIYINFILINMLTLCCIDLQPSVMAGLWRVLSCATRGPQLVSCVI
jgi:hypothetical protein